MRKVTIIGAGFSGLVSAHYLAKAGFNVEMIEAEARTGGLISTRNTPHGLVESAANGLLNSKQVEDFCSDIGLELQGTRKEARRRFIYRNGQLRRWPVGLISTFRMLVFVLKFIFNRTTVAPQSGESAFDWATRVLGEESAVYLVSTGLQGIYAGDPHKMSASLIVGRFFKLKAKPARPRIRGTVAPKNGMGELIRCLENSLKSRGVVFRAERATAMSLKLASQSPVVIATSAPEAAELTSIVRPMTSKALALIKMLPVTTCTAFFKETDPASRGFGCLFPPVDQTPALGVLKNDFIFEGRASDDVHAETWIFGGAQAGSDFLSKSDQQFVNTIQDERARVFGLKDSAVEVNVTRWPRALPHYTIELEKLLSEIEVVENNVALIGNYMGGIGLAQILLKASELPALIEAKGRWTKEQEK